MIRVTENLWSSEYRNKWPGVSGPSALPTRVNVQVGETERKDPSGFLSALAKRSTQPGGTRRACQGPISELRAIDTRGLVSPQRPSQTIIRAGTAGTRAGESSVDSYERH